MNLLRLIAESAWASGDPGVIFIDTINRANPTPHIGEIDATNPCGEQPLLPYESCCLGSINLSKLVVSNDVNWERLRELVHLRPLPGQRDRCECLSRAGNHRDHEGEPQDRPRRDGVRPPPHRLAIPYDAPQAAAMGEKIISFIEKESKIASKVLADERGAFPNFRGSLWDRKPPPAQRHDHHDRAHGNIEHHRGNVERHRADFRRSVQQAASWRHGGAGDRPLMAGNQGDARCGIDPGEALPEGLPGGASRSPEDSGDLPEPRGQRRLEDDQSPGACHPGRHPRHILEAYRMGIKGTTVFRDKSRAYQILSCGTYQIC